MSATSFPLLAVAKLALRAEMEGRPEEAAVLDTAIAAYDEAVRRATITQEAATVAQLAHEWASAYRAHRTLGKREPVVVLVPAYLEGEHYETTGPDPVTRASAAKLSGLARRLERACLGPRPKKEG